MRQNSKIPLRVQAIIFDFDGVFTDNRVIVNGDGEESVICNRSDGLGISIIKRTGIPLLVLSTEKNPVVTKRCEKLGISCFQNLENKKSKSDFYASTIYAHLDQGEAAYA